MAAIDSKPKGILKKPSISLQPKNKLKWDEDNIQLTEGQKNSTMKITEPKTPYIHYNQETDEIMTDLQTIPGFVLGSSSVSPAGSLSSVSPSSAHFPDSIKDYDWESENSEEEDEETKEKRRREFAQLRAKHYNMKDALSLGHKLVEDDEENDENDNDRDFNAFKSKLANNDDNSDNNDSPSNNDVFMET